MEKFTAKINSRKYDFRKGDEFVVKRTIMGECVVIREDKINIVLPEKSLRRYGTLCGRPYIEGFGHC